MLRGQTETFRSIMCGSCPVALARTLRGRVWRRLCGHKGGGTLRCRAGAPDARRIPYYGPPITMLGLTVAGWLLWSLSFSPSVRV
jgi:hypothetical protein